MDQFVPYLSVITVALAIYAAIRSNRKDATTKTTNDVSAMTTVIVKLENIDSGVKEIKSDFRTMKNDFDLLRERVAKNEESSKSAHKRLDEHCANEHHGAC